MVHQEAPVAVVHSEVQVVVDHVDHPATVARPVVMTARHACGRPYCGQILRAGIREVPT